MKRLVLILSIALISISLLGQNTFKYPIVVGATGGANGQITLMGSTSGSVVIKPNVVAGTGTIFQLPANNGTNGYILSTNGSGVLSWVAASTSMVYPDAGIPLSTGAAWGTSITNNSTNWNTAYSDRLKWDGGSTGLTAATGRTSLGGTTVGQALFTLTNPGAITFFRGNADNTVSALSATDFKTALGAGTAGTNLFSATGTGAVTFIRINADNTVSLQSATNFKTALSLNNVTNESKATMFTNPTFTGLQFVSTTDTLSTKAYARSVSGEGGIQAADTSAMLDDYINKADTAAMLANYSLISEVSDQIGDTLTARMGSALELSDLAVMIADTAAMLYDYINKADTASMLSKYLLITDYSESTGISASDTAAMLANYINKADTAAMLNPYAKMSDIEEGGISLSAVQEAIADSAVLLSDIRPYYTFGAGTGAAADSTLFAKGNKSFGSFRIIEDSLYVHSITNLYMTSGDSLKFNVYYGNGMTRTATDSLFTAPQGAGAFASQTFTPDNVRTINHDQDVWVGIIGPQPANKRPKEWVLQLNAKTVRD
jgi:hypothetical protein